MIKSEIPLEDYPDDLYQLGVIQGEHNIYWADEYNLLEHSKEYHNKTKSIADKYNIDDEISLEDWHESDDEEEYLLWGKLAFNINEITKEHIMNIMNKNY